MLVAVLYCTVYFDLVLALAHSQIAYSSSYTMISAGKVINLPSVKVKLHQHGRLGSTIGNTVQVPLSRWT
jgi:hypothetical protein